MNKIEVSKLNAEGDNEGETSPALTSSVNDNGLNVTSTSSSVNAIDIHISSGMHISTLQVNVAVYYESLCPDSRKFFTQQLYPSLQTNLSDFVNLTLVPYGKTKTKFDINEYHFDCHHGPAECYGNKIQACALKLIEGGKASDGLGFNRVSAGFINCLMDKVTRDGPKATFPTMECAQINHVNNLNVIENCVNHTDGSNYLSILGKLTDDVQNPLKSVPTIVFNKQFKQADNDLAQINFVKALCQYIEGTKPEECSKNGAHSLKISLGFVLLATVFARYFY
ncbi:hypothetical protein NQ314_003925 [Rhamnusium bicolor]|uniref:Gamma-interferon-inducible lysosomal thiol reductase n=1 Tax=Rhamnusium bicolor TaxID=1586634 RepID=A0AAV8ZKP9_9CUCU|nr:hypothetical protein NQ314_003925 [Rhamnusium bicolor]